MKNIGTFARFKGQKFRYFVQKSNKIPNILGYKNSFKKIKKT